MSENAAVELCEMYTGGRVFGIATSAIREVLGVRTIHRVPLAPDFIAGMVAYRGEVLTTVSLRSTLGKDDQGPELEHGREPERCVLVLDGGVDWKGDVEHFGLAVEAMGRVVADPERETLAENPEVDADALVAAAVNAAGESADEGWKGNAGAGVAQGGSIGIVAGG